MLAQLIGKRSVLVGAGRMRRYEVRDLPECVIDAYRVGVFETDPQRFLHRSVLRPGAHAMQVITMDVKREDRVLPQELDHVSSTELSDPGLSGSWQQTEAMEEEPLLVEEDHRDESRSRGNSNDARARTRKGSSSGHHRASGRY
jgi:hypothetical protein